jgi:prepilin-type N-terminal cleavage/methylation domain-containing protein
MKSPIVGFTLIELLVAITVAGILAAIAIPAFNNFVMNDRDATQINSLASSLNYARSMAVKLNTQGGVEVCPSSDGQTCNAPNWAAGWVVLDMTNPLAPVPLQAVPAFAGQNQVSAAGAGANLIIFIQRQRVHGSRKHCGANQDMRPTRRRICARCRSQPRRQHQLNTDAWHERHRRCSGMSLRL